MVWERPLPDQRGGINEPLEMGEGYTPMNRGMCLSDSSPEHWATTLLPPVSARQPPKPRNDPISPRHPTARQLCNG
jgi:hypothetical protein